VDEAYQMVSPGMFGGSAVLDLLLSEVENLTGRVVFIFAGYGKQMEAFAAHNPGLSSRISTTIKFPDYEDAELHQILVHELKIWREHDG
jgi:Cdc6-like AAA superfamily ATPase